MKALIISAAILLTFTLASAQGGEQVVVKNGQQKVTKTGRITVKFIELIEDSRCPADVNCIWAGVARLKIQLRKNGKIAEFELNTNQLDKTAVFEGHEVRLDNLSPYPNSRSAIRPASYAASFTVTKRK